MLEMFDGLLIDYFSDQVYPIALRNLLPMTRNEDGNF